MSRAKVAVLNIVVRIALPAIIVIAAAACTESSASPATPSLSARPSNSPDDVIAANPMAEPLPFPMDATIPELQAALEAGDYTSLELVEFYLARIATYDDAGPALNALIHVNPEARDDAAALDAERAASGSRGPLHGIPIVVKDNINTFDMPTTGGTVALDGFRSEDDAFQVARLREAGAIIIAKANLFELAHGWETTSPVGGQTLNPYDLGRDPGGSSGGTAVAVTANFAAAGLGTDTCGSIRLPAAHNNLYGLRPTSGLSSRAGVIPFSFTLDTVGPMARNVVDLAIVLDATAGEDPEDPTTVPLETSFVDAVDPDGLAGRRIGVRRFSLGEEIDSSLRAALDQMAANGAEIVEVVLPPSPFPPIEFLKEFRFALEEYLAAEPTAPGGALAEIMAQDPDAARVQTLDTEAYRNALARRQSFQEEVVAAMEERDLDAVAYPVSPRTAARIFASQEHWDCAAAAVSGAPAIAIPAGFTSDGLPVGLELMGRPFAESTLISIAAGYEAHTDHRMLPPTTPPLDVDL
jgi:Asp-tRNA(Asn)/Glu-tRNA(Gln) amidotransferase A subunit family amidase